MDFEYIIHKYILEQNLNNIAIAVSGGADSMYLLTRTQAFLKDKNINIYCLIVDHKIRSESTTEALYVKSIIERSQLASNIHIIEWNKSKEINSNVMLKAREARYELLYDFCIKNNIRCLLVGHNKNDQAETVFMRILRGTGIYGITSMYNKTDYKNIFLLRPMLNITRKEIENFLSLNKIEFVTDPTNSNLKYQRIKVRSLIKNNNIFPEELLINKLCLLAENTKSTKDFIMNTIENNNIVQYFDLLYALVDYSRLLEMHIEMFQQIIISILKKISGNYYQIRSSNLRSLIEKIKQKQVTTLSGCQILYLNNKILIIRESNAISNDIIELKFNHPLIWDNRIKIVMKTNTKNPYFITKMNFDSFQYIKKTTNLNIDQNLKPELYNKILLSLPMVINDKKQSVYYPILSIFDERFINEKFEVEIL